MVYNGSVSLSLSELVIQMSLPNSVSMQAAMNKPGNPVGWVVTMTLGTPHTPKVLTRELLRISKFGPWMEKLLKSPLREHVSPE